MRFLLCRVAIFVVLPLSPLSNRVTHGQPALFRRASQGKQHTVTLTWKASPSRVAGYNVYRKRPRKATTARLILLSLKESHTRTIPSSAA
jgi:hypothetical protein